MKKLLTVITTLSLAIFACNSTETPAPSFTQTPEATQPAQVEAGSTSDASQLLLGATATGLENLPTFAPSPSPTATLAATSIDTDTATTTLTPSVTLTASKTATPSKTLRPTKIPTATRTPRPTLSDAQKTALAAPTFTITPIPQPTQPPAPSVAPAPTEAPAGVGGGGGNCDPAYPTVCIPPPPPDLDCGDVNFKNFVVLPPDPHHFDRDHDGIGCES